MGNGNQRPCVGDLNFISRITQVTASAEGQRYAGGSLRVEMVGVATLRNTAALCFVQFPAAEVSSTSQGLSF